MSHVSGTSTVHRDMAWRGELQIHVGVAIRLTLTRETGVLICRNLSSLGICDEVVVVLNRLRVLTRVGETPNFID